MIGDEQRSGPVVDFESSLRQFAGAGEPQADEQHEEQRHAGDGEQVRQRPDLLDELVRCMVHRTLVVLGAPATIWKYRCVNARCCAADNGAMRA